MLRSRAGVRYGAAGGVWACGVAVWEFALTGYLLHAGVGPGVGTSEGFGRYFLPAAGGAFLPVTAGRSTVGVISPGSGWAACFCSWVRKYRTMRHRSA